MGMGMPFLWSTWKCKFCNTSNYFYRSNCIRCGKEPQQESK